MRALAGFSGLIALLVVSCGGSSSAFPDEAECPAPSPLPTVRNQPGVVSFGSYLNRLRSSGETLSKLRADLRANYPDDTFYRRDTFRPDFAEYADQTVCLAEAMRSLDPPNSRFTDFDQQLDTALDALIEHTRAGREAVRTRNVSDYRKWFEDADAKIAAVRDLMLNSR